MVKLFSYLRGRLPKLTIGLLLFAVLINTLVSFQAARAAQLTSRKLTLSTSQPSATAVTFTFSFVVPTTATIVKSVNIDICTTAIGTCTPAGTGVPSGLTTTAATANPQPVNLGDASGWTSTFTTNGRLRIAKSGNATTPTGTSSLAVANITNPSATNTTFYARITTYSDAAWTTAIDSGTVAASTAQQIQATATVEETLTFCVYEGGTCASQTGDNIVDLGILTTANPKSGTSKFEVATNASQGYVVTYNGATLTSGSFTIDGFGVGGATSSAGTEQFGINLRSNTTPSVGADVAGSAPIGTYTAPYGTANTFAFNPSTTTQIAQASGPVNTSTYTVSYVANIASLTETGTYTTTLTYVCTATY
jgi:hypothetical protein